MRVIGFANAAVLINSCKSICLMVVHKMCPTPLDRMWGAFYAPTGPVMREYTFCIQEYTDPAHGLLCGARRKTTGIAIYFNLLQQQHRRYSIHPGMDWFYLPSFRRFPQKQSLVQVGRQTFGRPNHLCRLGKAQRAQQRPRYVGHVATAPLPNLRIGNTLRNKYTCLGESILERKMYIRND